MIFDAETLESGWFTDRLFDVCVIGSGPAGLALALSLARQGRRVALMEGGGLEPSHRSHELYDGAIVGAEYWPLTAARQRMFGGSSNCWGAMCRPLEREDFERLPHHPLSGWPITRDDLEPYADLTGELLDLPDDRPPDRSLFQGRPEDFEPVTFRFARERLIGETHLPEIRDASRIELYLHANLIDLELDDRHRAVTRAVFRGFDRPDRFGVGARAYALCLGGLENPRFLLNANRQLAFGIGNQHDLVGRFFNEHPQHTAGHILLARPMGQRAFYAPTRQFIREQETLNIALSVIPTVDQLSFTTELLRSTTCSSATLERLAAMIRGQAVRCDRGGLEAFVAQWRDPEAILGARLDFLAEQALNHASRVRLDRATDRFGLRRIALDWRYSERDFHTVRTATIAFGQQLAAHNAGRLRVAEWLLEGDGPASFPGLDESRLGGPHHMCTTRMSDSPRTGVVDRDCCVHGMDNLYLGGSSVFATGGFANPTYTIVQLALRLADHLAAST